MRSTRGMRTLPARRRTYQWMPSSSTRYRSTCAPPVRLPRVVADKYLKFQTTYPALVELAEEITAAYELPTTMRPHHRYLRENIEYATPSRRARATATRWNGCSSEQTTYCVYYASADPEAAFPAASREIGGGVCGRRTRCEENLYSTPEERARLPEVYFPGVGWWNSNHRKPPVLSRPLPRGRETTSDSRPRTDSRRFP